MDLDEDELRMLLNPPVCLPESYGASGLVCYERDGLPVSDACAQPEAWVLDALAEGPVKVEMVRRRRTTRRCCDVCREPLVRGLLELRFGYESSEDLNVVCCIVCAGHPRIARLARLVRRVSLYWPLRTRTALHLSCWRRVRRLRRDQQNWTKQDWARHLMVSQ